MDFFNWLFNTDGFMPRFHCLNCIRELMWWYFANNLLIALAYYLIPVTLLIFFKYIKSTALIMYKHLFWMFSLFIFSCGSGHIINIFMLWYPIYYFSIFWDGVTAFVSLGTLAFLIAALRNFFLYRK